MSLASAATVTVELKEIHCQGCADDIRKYIWEQDGVQSVHADVSTNRVTVVFEAPFSQEKLFWTLQKSHFELVSPGISA